MVAVEGRRRNQRTTDITGPSIPMRTTLAEKGSRIIGPVKISKYYTACNLAGLAPRHETRSLAGSCRALLLMFLLFQAFEASGRNLKQTQHCRCFAKYGPKAPAALLSFICRKLDAAVGIAEDDTPTQSELKVYLSLDAVQALFLSERTPKGRASEESQLGDCGKLSQKEK